jgi:hypothetical protein
MNDDKPNKPTSNRPTTASLDNSTGRPYNVAPQYSDSYDNRNEVLILGLTLQELALTLLGGILLLAGFLVSIQLLTTVWGLFNDHELILTLSRELEKHSHLNDILKNSISQFLPTANTSSSTEQAESVLNGALELNISYFIAWILAILLLGLLIHLVSVILNGGVRLISAGKKQVVGVSRSDIKVVLQDLVRELKEQL